MKKICLHIIMPKQVSGPNTANRLIASSMLKKKYKFSFVTQKFHANSKISIQLINDLRKQLVNEQPDLVHLSGLQGSCFHAILAAKLAGCKKILVTIRGSSGDALNISRFKRFIFEKIIEPFTLDLCTNFYTVCEEAANKTMVKKHKNKFLGVIHNPAPLIRFDRKYERIKVRGKFSFNDEDTVVGIVGRMIYDKGISYIIEAIKLIKNDNIKFMFIGDGEYYSVLKNSFKKNVYVLGKRDDVLELLCGCDLFLFATLHENLSNALLEAMSVGLPIIATNVGGNPEVIEDGKNGYLIPPKDIDSIVEKIEYLAENKIVLNYFSQQSLKIINKKFKQEIILNKVDDVYKFILKE